MTGAGGIAIGAAVVAGIASSGHCLAMCGGVAAALSLRGKDAKGRRVEAVLYNIARIGSYAIAGAVAGLLGGAALHAVDVAVAGLVLRVLAGAVMLAVAGKLLFGLRLLDPLEAAGARIWRRVMPRAATSAGASPTRRAIALGLAWGALPCAMSYSMLLLAATTATAGAGAAVMLAFGVGTLPAMLGWSLLATSARQRLMHGPAGRTAGVLLLCFGAWTTVQAVRHVTGHEGGAGMHAGHESAVRVPEASPGGTIP